MKPSSSSKLNLAERYELVRASIADQAHKLSRDAQALSLIAVSKGQPLYAIKELYELGHRAFGESYAQELNLKIKESALLGMNDIVWHFIGALQSNKIKLIQQAQVVQSIGSITHARLLDQAASHPIDIFLQVNINNDPIRQGFAPSALDEAISLLESCVKLRLQGLMMIAPLNTAEHEGHWFAMLNKLRHQLASKYQRPLALSMGMSNDYRCAIEHGADVLRIGSSIFGARPPKA